VIAFLNQTIPLWMAVATCLPLFLGTLAAWNGLRCARRQLNAAGALWAHASGASAAPPGVELKHALEITRSRCTVEGCRLRGEHSHVAALLKQIDDSHKRN
jgi:hypothetical protein